MAGPFRGRVRRDTSRYGNAGYVIKKIRPPRPGDFSGRTRTVSPSGSRRNVVNSIEEFSDNHLWKRGRNVKTFRVAALYVAVAALSAGSGCVTGKVLHMPGDLYRPGKKAPAPVVSGGPTVAVLDFTYASSTPHVIGHDFDHVRSIAWKGDPGKALPDLIAAVLAEKGVNAVRVPDDSSVPPIAVAKLWGSVDTFRVETRKTGSLRLAVEMGASVSSTVRGTGGNAPPGWSTAVTSDIWNSEPLFVTPEGILVTVNGAANAVAEEAVRRLVAAGVVILPSGQPAGQEAR